MTRKWPLAGLALTLIVTTAACGGGGSSPSAPSPVTTTPPPASGGGTGSSATVAVAYNQDIKPILDTDCIVCHRGPGAPLGLELTTYANVLRVVQPGNANSRLVLMTQPGGPMYINLSGDRAAKSALIRSWVVDNNAAENR
jgi:hypothetical protein